MYICFSGHMGFYPVILINFSFIHLFSLTLSRASKLANELPSSQTC